MRHFAKYFDGRRVLVEAERKNLSALSQFEALYNAPEYCYGFRLISLPDLVNTPPIWD